MAFHEQLYQLYFYLSINSNILTGICQNAAAETAEQYNGMQYKDIRLHLHADADVVDPRKVSRVFPLYMPTILQQVLL